MTTEVVSTEADPSKISFSSTCPHCMGDLSELRDRGRENHRSFCFLQHLSNQANRQGVSR